MVHPYLRRRDGIEKADLPSPAPEHGPPDELQRVLGRTLGVPLFQEQAMQIAIDAAKFTPDEANNLRRAMATFRRMGTIGTLEDKFVGRLVARGYDAGLRRIAASTRSRGSANTAFPKATRRASRSSSMSRPGSSATTRPPSALALLNSQPMGFYAPAQIVRDAREHGVEVRPVDVEPFGLGQHARADGRRTRRASRLPPGRRHVEGGRRADRRRRGKTGPSPSRAILPSGRAFPSPPSRSSPRPTPSARSASTGARRSGRSAASTTPRQCRSSTMPRRRAKEPDVPGSPCPRCRSRSMSSPITRRCACR